MDLASLFISIVGIFISALTVGDAFSSRHLNRATKYLDIRDKLYPNGADGCPEEGRANYEMLTKEAFVLLDKDGDELGRRVLPGWYYYLTLGPISLF